MDREPASYRSYLLRLWRATNGPRSLSQEEPAAWHASLQDTLTGERIGFATLETLIGYLYRETGSPGDHTDAEESGS